MINNIQWIAIGLAATLTTQAQTFSNVPFPASSTGTIYQISASSDGEVWSVDTNQMAWRWNGKSWDMKNPAYQQVTSISAGSASNIWAATNTGIVYRWTAKGWQVASTSPLLFNVSAASDGTVVSADASGVPYIWNSGTNAWVALPGIVTQISAGSATNIWCVNPAGGVFQWVNSVWQQMPGVLTQISVSASGAVAGLNAAHDLWQWNASTNSWTNLKHPLLALSVVDQNTIWGVASGGKTLQTTGNLATASNPTTTNTPTVPAATNSITLTGATQAAAASLWANRRPSPTPQTTPAGGGCPVVLPLDGASANGFLQNVNFYRMMGRLNQLGIEQAAALEAQSAAVFQSTNSTLNQNPLPTSPCFTPLSSSGSQHSNLAVGSASDQPVDIWVLENWDPASMLAHRNAVLNPRLGSTYFGATAKQSSSGATSYYWAMEVAGQVAQNQAATGYSGWPPAGYVPAGLISPYGKSQSAFTWNLQSPGADFTGATVAVNGTAMTTRTADTTQIAWDMPAVTVGTAYQVVISNAKVGGVATSIQYSVTPFNP